MDDSELSSWPRPHYEPDGGTPFVFYVIYGRVDTAAALSSSQYRTLGIADGLEVMAFGPDAHPEVPGSFRTAYPWETLEDEDPALAAEIEAADSCVVVRGSPTDDTTLDYLRDTIGLITFFLDHGGITVYDPQMFRWWSPTAWRESVFDPGAPAPHRHTVILLSDEDDGAGTWYHTRGMRTFGRPDLSAHHVPPDDESAVGDLFNRMIDYMALGHVVPDGQAVRMDGVPEGTCLHHAGHVDDPDFNNVHLDITWGTGDTDA